MTEATSRPFCEHDLDFTFSEELLAQGDVLEFLEREKFPEGWHDVLGIVVTANCDLALGKHWGTITYVPAIPVDAYVCEFVIPKILTSARVGAEKKVRETLGPSGGGEVAERAIEMLELDYPLQNVAVLLGSDPSEKLIARFEKECSILQLIDSTLKSLGQCVSTEVFWRVVSDYAGRMDAVNSQNNGAALAKLRGDIKSYLKKLPGDVFYLSAPSPLHGRGYVATLRFIRSIEDTAVALRSVDELRSPMQYRARRVARLETLYCHRVVQQMASVFTDIGLPETYEQARDSHIGHYVEGLGGQE